MLGTFVKKITTFALDVRLQTMLCCSATILLTACGGGASQTGTAPQSPVAAPTSHMEIEEPDAPLATPPADAAALDDAVPPASETPTAPVDDAPQQLAITDIGNLSAPAAALHHLYVSPEGDDGVSGSSSAPFRTIGRAARAVKPSTTVHVAAGTYRENIKTNTHGTATARIYYVSDTKWGPKSSAAVRKSCGPTRPTKPTSPALTSAAAVASALATSLLTLSSPATIFTT